MSIKIAARETLIYKPEHCHRVQKVEQQAALGFLGRQSIPFP